MCVCKNCTSLSKSDSSSGVSISPELHKPGNSFDALEIEEQHFSLDY